MWLLEVDRTGRLLVSIANALINPASLCVPVRMINIQSESVVVFKGTKVGVVEETAFNSCCCGTKHRREHWDFRSQMRKALEDGRGWW